MDEVWPGVPRCDVQLDQPITRYPEGDNILDPRARVVAKVARWRHTDKPFLAAERPQTLRDPPVTRDPGEAEPDMWQVHDPQSRLAVAQDELWFARRCLRVIAALGALAAGSLRCDDMAVGCERLRCQLPYVQHVPW